MERLVWRVLQIIIGKNSKFFFFTFSEVHVHIYGPNVTLASSSSFILNNMLHQLRLIFEIYFLYEFFLLYRPNDLVPLWCIFF